MSLFFGRGESRAMTSWLTDSSTAGRVTPDRARYLTPVFAAFRHIYDYTSSLPVVPYRTDEQGRRVRMPSLPTLLASCERGDGPAGTGYGVRQWFGQAALALALDGNAVGFVHSTDNYSLTPERGRPTDVRWLARRDWEYDESTRQWFVYGRPVSAEQVVHIPWMPLPGFVLGLSPIEHYAALVSAGLSAQEYADVKRGGGIPPAILRNVMKVLDPKAAAAVQAKAVQSFASGRPFVTGKDWDLSIVSIPPAQAQFIETLRMTASGIASIYGLDPREVGGQAGDSLTYSTDESRALNRANNMRPYVERLEQAVSRLLPASQSVNLDLDSTIRADIKTRTDVMRTEIELGVASIDEWRHRTDRMPVPGGDIYRIPGPKAPEPTVRSEG